jgi:hypothetical protein
MNSVLLCIFAISFKLMLELPCSLYSVAKCKFVNELSWGGELILAFKEM